MRENIPTYNNPSHPVPYIDNWQNNTRVWSPWLQVSHKTQARSAGISSPHSVLISFWHSDIPFNFKSSCSCKYQCRDRPYFLNNSQPSCPNVHIKSHLVFFFLSFPAVASINIESLSHQKHWKGNEHFKRKECQEKEWFTSKCSLSQCYHCLITLYIYILFIILCFSLLNHTLAF